MMRQAGRYLAGISRICAQGPAAFSICASRRNMPPRLRCSRSAASTSMPRSSSPTFSSSPTRSAARCASRPAKARGSIRWRRRRRSRALAAQADFGKLEPVYEALRRVRRELDPKIALIGFCGAPWTVATYMVAGQGTPDQAPARMMAYRHPEAFAENHRRAGGEFDPVSARPAQGRRRRAADLRHLGRRAAAARISALVDRADAAHRRGRARAGAGRKDHRLSRGAGALLPAYVEATGVNAVSIDWAAEPSLIRERVQNRVAVQGNLDPLVLIAGGAALDRAVDDVLANYGRRPADLQPRPRHPAGNADRACRADAEAGAGAYEG